MMASGACRHGTEATGEVIDQPKQEIVPADERASDRHGAWLKRPRRRHDAGAATRDGLKRRSHLKMDARLIYRPAS